MALYFYKRFCYPNLLPRFPFFFLLSSSLGKFVHAANVFGRAAEPPNARCSSSPVTLTDNTFKLSRMCSAVVAPGMTAQPRSSAHRSSSVADVCRAPPPARPLRPHRSPSPYSSHRLMSRTP